MNAVENIESLIKKYFDESVCIKDKSISNNCISALVIENDYTEFKQNFERRLERLAKKITDSVQRKEVIEKIKNLAEKTGYKWSGAYSELVALDFFLNSDYLIDSKFINKFNISNYPNSLAAKNAKEIIDIDFSFELKTNKYFTDIKSLIPTQIEILDMIIENVTKNSFQKNIIIGVEDLHPESFIDLQYVVKSETNRMEAELLKAVNNTQGHVDYITEKGFSYHFRISYNGMLSTMQTMNPYEIARLDKYKFLNYCNKLLDTDYSFLTFVVNPWFNRQILELGDFAKFYYRSVSRRVFVEFKNDTTPAYLYFKDIANNSITLGDISSNIAGILFIEDKSIETDDDGILYKGYLYLNPNYKNKRPLTIFDFSLSFENLPISKMMEIDDFREDNY